MAVDGEKQIHTVEEILALPEGERAELLDGEIFLMASPTLRHQDTLGWLHAKIWNHIQSKGGKCSVNYNHISHHKHSFREEGSIYKNERQ